VAGTEAVDGLRPGLHGALATAALLAASGYTDGLGHNAARPEQAIRHRRARLTSGIGAPAHGAQAKPNEERSRERQEQKALGMTGKQYRAYLKTLRQTARETGGEGRSLI
jgi:hypothetical protein